MPTFADEADASYAMALRSAEYLKSVNPKHELLRLIAKADQEIEMRRDEERIERFWIDKGQSEGGHGFLDEAPRGKIDAITYTLLARAMDRAAGGPIVIIRRGMRVEILEDGTVKCSRTTASDDMPL